MDITHQVEGPDGALVPAIDFISTVNTNYYSELNMWYHSLNVGYRARASGETDFPCISGERVGLGRSYVKLDGNLDYDAWCEGIRQGRCYVSNGRSHLMDFEVNGLPVGERGSELRLPAAGPVRATAKVAAYLPPEAQPGNPDRRGLHSWNLERARIAGTRNVNVELIVNGYPVASQELTADGATRDVTFDGIQLERSSWIAMRIPFSSHSNPVFALVNDKPIRASRRSAQWCLDGVEQCWKSKAPTYRAEEMDAARLAYEHARQEYRRLLSESDVD